MVPVAAKTRRREQQRGGEREGVLDIALPTSRGTELALLGAVLIDRAALEVAIAKGVSPQDFGEPDLREAWAVLQALLAEGKMPSAVTLSERGVDAALVAEAISRAAGGAAYAEEYAETLIDLSERRRFLLSAMEAISRVGSRAATPQEALSLLAEAVADRRERALLETLDDEAIDEVLTVKSHGMPTGLYHVDLHTGGLYRDLNILMARPAMGKTITALQIMDHVAQAGGRVLFISMDTPRQNIIWRQIVRHVVTNSDGLFPSREEVVANPERWRHLIEPAKAWVKSLPIHYRFGGTTVHEVRLMARRLHAAGDLALIVVDYLQQLEVPGKTEEFERVTEASRRLKDLAITLEVPVLAVSQLSRQAENRGDKRPMLADLRQSGQIEQDAALVMGLYRPHYYDPKADPSVGEILILKQKDGPTGTVTARWIPGWGYETQGFQPR